MSWAIFLKKKQTKKSSRNRTGRGREKGVRRRKRLVPPGRKLANVGWGQRQGLVYMMETGCLCFQ